MNKQSNDGRRKSSQTMPILIATWLVTTALALAMNNRAANATCATQYCWAAGSADWSVSTNWVPNAIPGLGNTVTINNGATVTTGSAGIFSSTTYIDGGSAVVVSAGSSWTDNGNAPGFNLPGGALIVGRSGVGALVISDGASVSTVGNTAGSVLIGSLSGSAGTLTVGTGGAASATLINSGPVGYPGNLNIGYAGDGVLTINSNGIVSGFDGATLGSQAGSHGTVTVNGGTLSISPGNMTIGKNGQGTLLIENGGSATGQSAYIAGGIGSDGSSATITGAGSVWNVTNQLEIGIGGSGSLNVASGGAINLLPSSGIQSQIYIGSSSGNGLVVVDGGAVNAGAAQLFVGGNGNGQATMLIENGGQVTSTGTSYLGPSGNPGPTSTGTVTVTGMGSSWTTGTLLVENPGIRTSLSIANGARLVSGEAILGNNAVGGNNAVDVTGVGTTWQSGAILLGNVRNVGSGGGTATLSVSHGAHVNASGNIDVGYNPDGGNGVIDTISVNGAGSNVSTSGSLRVGYFGNGALTISNAATITNGEGDIGYSSTNPTAAAALFGTTTPTNSAGSVLITGTGSSWFNTSLIVGYNAAIPGYTGTGTGTATASLTVADGGLVASANPIVIAANIGAKGTINIGAPIGEAAAAPGAISAPAIQFGNGIGSIVFNHNSNSYVLNAPISGNGLVDFESGVTTLAGTNTYTGATLVNSGTLNIAGSISGTSRLTVNQGGTLTGSGVVASPEVLIGSGAIFAPGGQNTPGTSMTISGNLSFQSGATYAVYLSPTSGTSANVSGTASLSGTVAAYFQPGSYVSKTYNILHSGGLGGTTFSGLTVSPANFKADLGYDATDVFLNLTAQMGANDNLNRNQRGVANALNRFFNAEGALPPAFASIYTMSGAALGNTLSHLNGQVANGAAASALQLDSQFITLLLDRALDPRPGIVTSNSGPLSFNSDKTSATATEIAGVFARAAGQSEAIVNVERRWSVWGAAFGGTRSNGGDIEAGAGGTTTGTYGLTTGAEYRLSADSLIGVALAGGGTDWRLSDSLGSGSSNAMQAGLYGSTWFGAAYVASSITFSNHWFSTSRSALGTQLTAEFVGQSYGAKLEGGYRIDATPVMAITPYWSLQLLEGYTPAYRETTAGSFGLAYASNNLTDIRTELGLRLESKGLIKGSPVLLSGKVGWGHDTVGTIKSTAAFQALSGTEFIVSGAPVPMDAALVTAKAQWQINDHWSIAAQIHTESAPNAQSYSGTGEVRFTW